MMHSFSTETDFREKILRLRSEVIIGKTIDLHPYGMEHLDDILRLRNQSRVKYFLAQEYDISRAQQIEWIKGYEQRTDEIGFMVRNKRNEMVGISFCFNYDGNAMELGRTTFDTMRLAGMPYALEIYMLSADLVFNYLEVPTLKSFIKSDNFGLLKFYKKMNWTVKGSCNIRGKSYEVMELHQKDSIHTKFQYILEARRCKHPL